MRFQPYGQLKQRVTFSLTPYCLSRMWLLCDRNRITSISDMFEKFVRYPEQIKLDMSPPDDNEVIEYMKKHHRDELPQNLTDEIINNFRNKYFTDRTPTNTNFSDFK